MESRLYDSKNSLTYKFGLHLLDFVPRDDKQSIIDIGSGSGALTKELTHYAGSVIGVDKDVHVVARAMEKYPTLTFYAMDASRLQYENRFDVAFSNATFHEVEDKAKLCASLFKCIKEGGRLVTEFPASDCSTEYFDALREALARHGVENGVAYYFIDKRACKKLLEDAGFEVVHLKHYRRHIVLRCDKDTLMTDILGTIASHVASSIRDAVAREMLEFVESHYAVKDGYDRDIARVQMVAVKPMSR